MARHPRGVDQAIARFDDLVHRLDARSPGAAAESRHYGRAPAAVASAVASRPLYRRPSLRALVGPDRRTASFIVVLPTLAI
jgi:uncharacterized iron-regulated membrane protein